MMNENPIVTIVIIAYNEERFISQAIESALAQTYGCIEIIVVDDGSIDTTLKIAKNYSPSVTVVSQANSGNCSFPRNKGLSLATGEYISFLDADDILLPQKISQQVHLMKNFPDAAMVVNDYCNFRASEEQKNHFSSCPKLSRKFDETQSETLFLEKGIGADILLDENFTIASSPLFKVSSIKSLGGFCTELYACEDYHLNYRMAVNFPILVNKDVLFKRRLHGENMSSNLKKMSKYYSLSRLKLLEEENDKNRREKLRTIVKSHISNFIKRSVKDADFKNFCSAFSMKLKCLFI